MMDRVVPGGVTADLDAAGALRIVALMTGIRQRFSRLVDLYDKTASLQDRTVGTGILRPGLAEQFGAGGFVGRASGRRSDARRWPGYAPYDELAFEIPVQEEGDVNARLWIRVREIEQSMRLIEQILTELPEGQIRTDRNGNIADTAREGLAIVRDSEATFLHGFESTPAAASNVVICATRHGSNGLCWKLRSRATSLQIFRSATNPSTAPIRGMTSENDRCAGHSSRASHVARLPRHQGRRWIQRSRAWPPTWTSRRGVG
jgi:NADH:ubiquinone oxidoreductase subunit D